MLNIQKSKNTVLISNISIITFLNLALYTRIASLLASRGLEALGRTSRGRGQDSRGWGRGQDPWGRGQVFWPRGRGQALRLNITAFPPDSLIHTEFTDHTPERAVMAAV